MSSPLLFFSRFVSVARVSSATRLFFSARYFASGGGGTSFWLSTSTILRLSWRSGGGGFAGSGMGGIGGATISGSGFGLGSSFLASGVFSGGFFGSFLASGFSFSSAVSSFFGGSSAGKSAGSCESATLSKPTSTSSARCASSRDPHTNARAQMGAKSRA